MNKEDKEERVVENHLWVNALRTKSALPSDCPSHVPNSCPSDEESGKVSIAPQQWNPYYRGLGSRCPKNHMIVSSLRVNGLWWNLCPTCEQGFPETSPLDISKGKWIRDLIGE